MNTFVIDASVAIKWVIQEDGTSEALAVRRSARLIAPDLLAAECANILWKKVRRGELSKDEAFLAGRLIQAADMELLPSGPLLEAATRIAVQLDHPAYDCVYVALAIARDCRFVTADDRLIRKIEAEPRRRDVRARAISLVDAARELNS